MTLDFILFLLLLFRLVFRQSHLKLLAEDIARSLEFRDGALERLLGGEKTVGLHAQVNEGFRGVWLRVPAELHVVILIEHETEGVGEGVIFVAELEGLAGCEAHLSLWGAGAGGAGGGVTGRSGAEGGGGRTPGARA